MLLVEFFLWNTLFVASPMSHNSCQQNGNMSVIATIFQLLKRDPLLMLEIQDLDIATALQFRIFSNQKAKICHENT
eukprot:3435286-Amphidinium_carterae.2